MNRFLLAIVLALLAVTPARAQQPDGAEEVVLELASFGVRGMARPADWTGIRLNVTDRADEPREVMIRMRLTDADGDHPTPTRVIATNPGVTQGVWLYAFLPPKDTGFEVLANAAIQNDDGTYRPGRILGSTVVQPTGAIARPPQGLMLLLGSRYMSLSQYIDTYQGQMYPPASHEQILIAKDLRPNDLPDRWVGLSPFDAIIWTEGDPIELTSERAEAVREWIRRGGHLVIVLPRVGQSWYTNRNPLVDVLPSVTITRLDGVNLEPYRPLICDRPLTQVSLPDNATVHRLDPREGAAPMEAAPILNAPDGFPVVVRRLVGLGAVTLIGLDLNTPALAATEAIDPDVFWHRVLGRRGDLFTQREMTDLAQAPGATQVYFPGRNAVDYDGAFDAEIAKTGRAAAGVLLGFVIFVLFWIVAGPGGFALLKSTGRVKHAWVAYAGATALFTVIAWGGATLIRPSRVDVSYLRMVSHVYGQPVQHARVWASVLIPEYGEATISVGDPETDSTNTITPWRQPSGEGIEGGFPDARAYPILANDLDSITVPTRSTVKQVMADWTGLPAWAMPIPVAPEGEEIGELQLLTEEQRQAIEPEAGFTRPDLAGALVHNLPAALEDVVIVVVKQQRDLYAPRTSFTRLAGSPLLADARAYSRTTPWAPGQALDLMQATSVPVQQNNRVQNLTAEGFLERLLPARGGSGLPPRASDIDLTQRLTALALYPMLEPPDPTERTGQGLTPIVSREQTHGLDLGLWFTQPCVIIIGHIPDLRDPDEPGPGSIYVDGRLAPMRGRTVVRWVYPLPPDPPDYPPVDPNAPAQFSPIPDPDG